MSCYNCAICGNFFDSDFSGCWEYKETQLICEGCYEDATKDDSIPKINTKLARASSNDEYRAKAK